MKTLLYLFIFCFVSFTDVSGQREQTNYIAKKFAGVSTLEAKLFSKNINIKTWDKNEVSIIAIIPSEKKAFNSEDELLELSGIQISMENGVLSITDKNFLDIDSVNHSALGLEIIPGKKYISKQKTGYFYFNGEVMIPLDKAVKNAKFTTLNKKYLDVSFIIMVPGKTILKINDEYGMLSIDSDVENVTIRGDHITAICSSIQVLKVNASNSSLSFINIDTAEFTITDTRLFADSIQTAVFISSGSNINISDIHFLKLSSSTDEYVIRTAYRIQGTKKHGRLTVNVLNESIKVEAENSNMAFNRVGANLKNVDIQNRFASIRFGVSKLESLMVSVKGVNTFASLPVSSSTVLINRGSTSNETKSDYLLGIQTERTPLFRIRGDYCSINFQ